MENESVLIGFEKEAELILKKRKKCMVYQKELEFGLKYIKCHGVCWLSNLSCVSVSVVVLNDKNSFTFMSQSSFR